jgi:hypothetical protein
MLEIITSLTKNIVNQFDQIKNDENNLQKVIVNAPFQDKLLCASIDLGIISLMLVDESGMYISCVSMTDNDLAHEAQKVSETTFCDIKIPVYSEDSILSAVILNQSPELSDKWSRFLSSDVKLAQIELSQKAASIESCLAWPLNIPQGGVMLFSFFQPKQNIGKHHYLFAEAYSKFVSDKIKEFDPSISLAR